jgi:hypothetical protein
MRCERCGWRTDQLGHEINCGGPTICPFSSERPRCGLPQTGFVYVGLKFAKEA